MCHLILLLPVFGLVVFWIWPLYLAAPVYVVIVGVSALFYFYIMQAMRRKVSTGKQGLLHERVEVIDSLKPEGHVRVHGEIWKAVSPDRLRQGEQAEIVAVDGLTLTVRKKVENRQGEQSKDHHTSASRKSSDKEVSLCH